MFSQPELFSKIAEVPFNDNGFFAEKIRIFLKIFYMYKQYFDKYCIV